MRQHDFVRRRLARPPAAVAQEIGRRGEDVGQRAEQIAPAVAVVVDGVAGEGRGHELGVAEGAGPGAFHGGGVDAVDGHHAQRLDQLGGEEFRTPLVAGQGGQRTNGRVVAHDGAVVGFQAPEGDQHLGLHAVLGLHAGQQRGVLRQHLPAGGDALVGHGVAEIAPEAEQELGLAAVELDDLGIGGRDAGKGALHDVARDAAAHGVGLQVRHAGAEGGRIESGGNRFAGAGQTRGGRLRRGLQSRLLGLGGAAAEGGQEQQGDDAAHPVVTDGGRGRFHAGREKTHH